MRREVHRSERTWMQFAVILTTLMGKNSQIADVSDANGMEVWKK